VLGCMLHFHVQEKRREQLKYQCRKCEQEFIHPAIIVDDQLKDSNRTVETHVCPYCLSLNYDEVQAVPEQVEAVYVHDLQSGENTALNDKLAEGYKITSRYAKQYVLEKAAEPAQVNNAYCEMVVNPNLAEQGYRITLGLEGKTVVFTNCQLQKEKVKEK